MKTSLLKLNITIKLALLLLLFIVIFYGTIALVFFHVQKMKTLSQEIVTVNTKVINYSREMSRILLDMDASARKYSLLQTEGYLKNYYAASASFDKEFSQLNSLLQDKEQLPKSFLLFSHQYNEFSHKQSQQDNNSIAWIDKATTQVWLNSLDELHDSYRSKINASLVSIHDQAQHSIRNGLYGLLLSIFAAFFGVWFISKSIIIPLKQLTHGLRNLSEGKDTPPIHVTSQDAFQDLAAAYNDMSSELREQESLRADFIASLSHEIRTPLSSIQESVSLIAEELVGPITNRQQKLLLIAIEELKRLRELLDHLMQTSLLQTKGLDRSSQMLDPLQLVSDSLILLEPSAKQKNIRLTVDCDNPCQVTGYPDEMQQVLVNIIGNAIKFSDDNTEVAIRITCRKETLTIRISDQGPGIDEAEKQLIFKKYFRSKGVRKHMDGVGLGLFISNKIVRHLSGNLTVENNTDKGCTFTISLPTTL